MVALTLDAARNIAIVVLVVLVVLAALVTKIIANITGKVIALLLIAGLALGVWTQRTSLSDCADRVEADRRAGVAANTTCRFFGNDISVPAPSASVIP